uniref:Putative transcriptional regulatory protein n=1 Tax=Talaromyces marneffei PM1 TaxID=1077442 RepID=A0A093V075_TALMA
MADGQPPPHPLPLEQHQPRPSRRREKPQLSCTLCRRRKGEPCGTCVRRGLASSCAYVRSNGQGPVTTTTQPAVSSMTDRIAQLERMVISLVDSNKTTGASEFDRMPSPVMTMLPQSPGMPAPRDATNFQTPRHWGQIRISELKNMFSHAYDPCIRSAPLASTSPSDNAEFDILFGSHRASSRQEILAAIPSKSVVDKIVAGYFLDRPIVSNPLGTPMAWIGLLFAVMCLVLSHRPEMVPMVADHGDLARVYGERIAQCLHLGKYTRGAPYTIEALLLYLHIELLRGEDTRIEPWMILGIIVRLAYRMGYHRDPSHFSNISPFDGEMRRRLWSMLVQLDIQISGQVGLPRMAREDQGDTREPRNLLDEDLHHDMQELPPPRPEAVQTEIQYSLSESKLLSIRGRIDDWKEALTNRRINVAAAEADVARLDKQLDDAYAALPELLPFRSLNKDRWKLRPLLKASCLMATAVLCSEIDSLNNNASHNASVHQPYQDTGDNTNIQNVAMNDLTAGKRAEIFQALHGSCLVWTHLSENSQEAQKAAEAVRSVLNKMHHADINLSPSVDTGSILDMTMNSSMIIPSNSVAGSSSAMIQLLDQQTSGHGANIPHSTSSPHLPNHLAHHSGIGEESQMQYDPLSPTQLSMNSPIPTNEKSVGLVAETM